MSIRRPNGQTGTSPRIADSLPNSAQESAAPTTVSRSVLDRWRSLLLSGRGQPPTARPRSAATLAGAGTATRRRHEAASLPAVLLGEPLERRGSGPETDQSVTFQTRPSVTVE